VLATADIFLFEEFRLDRRGEGLSRRDERGVFVPVAIGPRALDVLAVLVDRPGELVLKEEIMAAVWGRTVVESANLTVQISTLRRILDKGQLEGSCIQTIAARGSLCRAGYPVGSGNQVGKVPPWRCGGASAKTSPPRSLSRTMDHGQQLFPICSQHGRAAIVPGAAALPSPASQQ